MITTIDEWHNATRIKRLEFAIDIMQELQEEDSNLDYSEQIANACRRIEEIKAGTAPDEIV